MAAVNQTVKLIDHVIEHMSLTSQRAIHGGILLTGDPGIGKTTFVEILGALLGIKCIVIEVPHITEEHLINIPFLVVDKGQHPKSGVSREAPQEDIDNPQYKMILAQSNLYTQIVNTTPMNDAAYIQHIKNSSQYIQDLYKHLGGTETEIPEVLNHARSKFHVILFLDEFFRSAPIRIRNVLRDILNNRIGMHEIPASTYILYASNKNDKGLDKMPSNYQFDEINFKPPTKDDWFGWFISKFHNNEEVRLNEQVIKHFQELLTDEDISYEDIDTKIRTSPRRWEQMLLYISTALPVNSEREAHILLTNIRSNFIHYLQVDEHGTNLISKTLANKVLKAVATLIKDTSNITAKASDKVDEADWREALDHQVKMQMKLGRHKKHVPIVSGPPGIGKSSRGYAIAEENNLRFVPVDISAIYADDVTGLPIPGKSDANKTDMSIKFSMPKLYHQIMKGIEAADALYINELKAKYGTGAQEYINKYEHARWKYLILLDELNRVDQKTFNALRKVILEKNFGPKGDNSGENLTLPKEAIVIGAINPTGQGTSPFTEHFRDAVDFVHAKANWDDTVALLQSKTVKDFKGRVIPTKFNEAAMNLIQIFVNKFKTRDDKVPVNQQPYHLDIGAAVYVSSREYSQLWTRLVQRLSRVIDGLPQEATPTQARHAINEAVSDIFDTVLSFPLTKANVDGQEFFATLKAWIAGLPSTAFVGLLSKTVKVSSVVTAMGKYLDGKDLLDMLENQNLKNAHDASTNDQVISDVVEMFTTKVKNTEEIKHYILDKKQKMVEPTQDSLVFGSEPASLLENFVLGLVYTLHLHNYENARLTVIGKALSKSFASILSKLKTDEAIDDDTYSDATSAIIDLRQKVLGEINKLNPQSGK